MEEKYRTSSLRMKAIAWDALDELFEFEQNRYHVEVTKTEVLSQYFIELRDERRKHEKTRDNT